MPAGRVDEEVVGWGGGCRKGEGEGDEVESIYV